MTKIRQMKKEWGENGEDQGASGGQWEERRGTNALISNYNLCFETRTLLQRQCLHFLFKIWTSRKQTRKALYTTFCQSILRNIICKTQDFVLIWSRIKNNNNNNRKGQISHWGETWFQLEPRKLLTDQEKINRMEGKQML